MVKRFIAVVASFAVALAALLVVVNVTDINDLVAKTPWCSYMSTSQQTRFSFVEECYQERIKQGDNPKLVFGTSELNPSQLGDYHMQYLFSNNNWGFDIMQVGRGVDQALWIAEEIGAMADQMTDKRVVIYASMQWFTAQRNMGRDFPGSFSEDAWETLVANDQISDELKTYMARKMAAYGVDTELHRTQVHGTDLDDDKCSISYDNENPLHDVLDAINEWGGNACFTLRTLTGAKEASVDAEGAGGVMKEVPETVTSGEVTTPDWDSIIAAGLAEAQEESNGNDEGYQNKWNDKTRSTWEKGAAKWHTEEGSEFAQSEKNDFEALLKVCQQTGVTPLIIIQPVDGNLFDGTMYPAELREEWYQWMRDICDEYGVEYADFSGYEYDKYFLRDQCHPSAYGAALYAQAIYEFFAD